MSGIPPKIPASTTSEGLQTPASEWASKTTSALNPETTNTAGTMNPTTGELLSKNPKYRHPERNLPPAGATSSSVSTPGIPGAYHEDKDVPRDQQFSLSDTATRVSHTVQTTAQRAGEAAAQYFPQSVVDTVSAYMPASLAPSSSTIRASSHDVSHVPSLPSSELKGTQPGERVGGVGSLPGNISEVSVGKLPDERIEIDEFATSKAAPSGESWGVGGMVAGAAAGVGATAAGVYETVRHAVTGNERAPAQVGSDQIQLPPGTQYTERKSQMLHGAHKHDEHEPAHPVRSFESLPSEEIPTTSRRGVGSLPGATDESGVAVLPDEKKQSGSEGRGVSGAVTGAAAGVGATVGGVYEAVKSRVTGQPDESETGTTKQTTLPSSEKPSTSAIGVGSLPGDIHEQGVARLPDEQNRKRRIGITGATDPGVGTHPRAHDFAGRDLPSHEGGLSREPVGGVGSLPGGNDEAGVGILPDEREGGRPSKEDLQQRESEEYDERRGQALATGVSGVGPPQKEQLRPGVGESRKSDGEIPQSREAAAGVKGRRASHGDEAGAVGREDQTKKDDEKRREEEVMAAGIGAGAAAGAAAAAGGHVLSGEETKKVPGGEGEHVHGEKKTSGKAAKSVHGKSNQGSGYDTSYHPAELHPATGKYEKSTEGDQGLGTSEAQKKVSGPDEKNTDLDQTAGKTEKTAREGVSEKAHEMKGSSEDTKGHHEKTKKVGFMEKMKGEAKMLLGKAEGGKKGEDKIEEGRKIKSGEAHSSSIARG